MFCPLISRKIIEFFFSGLSGWHGTCINWNGQPRYEKPEGVSFGRTINNYNYGLR